MVFGACLFAATLVPPRLRGGAARRVGRLAAVAVPLAVLATLLRLPLVAAAMGGGWADALDPAMFRAVASGSAVGRAWTMQLAAVGVLAAAWAWRGRPPLLACTAGAVAVSLALSGHVAALPGLSGPLARGGLALHLLAGGAWIGSLPEVLHLAAAPRPSRAPEHAAEDAALALRRFSTAGHGAVALVIATGALDTLLVAGPTALLPTSTYGAVLDGKILLAGAMTGLAIVNRYRTVPRLGRDPEGAGRALRGGTRGVLGLALAAVLASGVLGLLDPP